MERAPVANVSLLTDLLIANLPADGLRLVLRTLVSSHPDIVKDLTSRSQSYLQMQYIGPERTIGGDLRPPGDIGYMQKIIRSFIGCRLPVESLLLLAHTLRSCKSMFEASFGDQERLLVVSMDGDIAQALSLLPTKCPGAEAISAIEDLFSSIESLKTYYRFERSRATLNLLHPDLSFHAVVNPSKITGIGSVLDAGDIETFRIGDRSVPRVFCGLWQLCSSAWGVSPLPEIMDGFETYIRKGFTAFDMADLYGDVEVIFVSLKIPCPHVRS
ncbi:hypothetical protein MPH_11039 [Macrophomina phaseolina MS6]|uniref:NADP-dependent oxidoreductase domain-containing protein n=1 Tax=Macrophomina phaseolina (strain MS6) TaxID=1126212 RepID=K2QNS3_MACPH|nr:hypothetical protein MPH_11039 [Macrophomina phaseolina MS6]